jgi:prephenate dehydrogenase
MAADAEPPFPHVAIVGFGLIGGSLGLAIRERWPKAMIIAIDRKDVIETAMRLGAADIGGDDLGLAAGAELIVLAAPALANVDVLLRLEEFVPGPALVTDVSSTKRAITEAARTLPSRLRFIGGHPLAGAAVGGVEAARADLFTLRPWILTPGGTPSDTTLAGWLSALGAKVRFMTPEAHDELLAYISHLPQMTASALMSVVGAKAGAQGLSHAGRGLRDTTRLASSPADVWRDIAATNRDHLAAALEELIAVLQNIKDDLSADGGTVETVFASAAEWKRVLEEPFDK